MSNAMHTRSKIQERDLSNTSQESHPDAMVKPSMNPIHSNTRNRELLDHLLGHLAASLVRVLVFIVVRWKTVKVVDQIRLLGDIDCHRAWAVLPVSREDDHGLWLHFGRDRGSRQASLRGIGSERRLQTWCLLLVRLMVLWCRFARCETAQCGRWPVWRRSQGERNTRSISSGGRNGCMMASRA